MQTQGDSASRHILIVDDDEGMRENLAELFESLGYHVQIASNASEALDRLSKGRADIVLTDYKMPGLTGVELIDAVHRKDPGIRAVLMTAFGDNFTEIESVRRGAVGYISKPFEAEEVASLVEKILSLRGKEPE